MGAFCSASLCVSGTEICISWTSRWVIFPLLLMRPAYQQNTQVHAHYSHADSQFVDQLRCLNMVVIVNSKSERSRCRLGMHENVCICILAPSQIYIYFFDAPVRINHENIWSLDIQTFEHNSLVGLTLQIQWVLWETRTGGEALCPVYLCTWSRNAALRGCLHIMISAFVSCVDTWFYVTVFDTNWTSKRSPICCSLSVVCLFFGAADATSPST